MPSLSREALVDRMIKAGEAEVAGAPPEEIARYFDVETFRFHGPDGFETDYAGLNAYFAAIRAAFTDRTIRRGIIVVEGDTLACQTWIEGTFTSEFAMSPRRPAAAERRTCHLGPDQHLPLRRPGPTDRGVRADGLSQLPAPTGR